MPIRANSDASLVDSIGWIDGRWLPFQELALPLSDLGVRQAVTVVERLRTYHGKLFGQSRHLRRLEATAAGINIPMLPDRSMWSAMIAELLAKNAAMLEREGDVGVTLLVTPGRVVPGRGKPVSSHDNTDNGKPSHCDPTVIMHVNRIDHDAINRRQTQGQPIVVTDVVQPPNESWPRHWKVRCRLHYYLADVTAKELHPNATGILRNSDKTVTESSIANIAIVESGEIFSPPRSQVLGGITQSYIEQLATEASLRWTFEPLTAERVSQADEILLMGTDGGVWWGWTLERTPATISPGPVFAQLRQAFDKLVAA